MPNDAGKLFDVLILTNNDDFQCYMQIIQDPNFSCTLSNQSNVTTKQSSFNYKTDQLELANIDNYNFYFIVDNTPFPPNGAFVDDFIFV